MAHELAHPDYGTGEKKLTIYLLGVALCVILTLLAFGVILSHQFSRLHEFILIYLAAFLQFLVQVICFLRLNTQTPQSRINVMSLVFTAVVLFCIFIGSMWIMWNLHFNMIYPTDAVS